MLCGLYLSSKKKRHGHALERRRQLRARRRRAFARRQSRERVMFAFLLSMALASQSRMRSVWMKPKSSSWWEEIVMSTFAASDWLENFRMSHATFLYVCNERHHHEKRYSRGAASGSHTLVSVYWYGLSDNRTPLRCFQVCSLPYYKGSLHRDSASFVTKICPFSQSELSKRCCWRFSA